MYAMKAMKQYQQVSIEAQVSDANPHRLIQLLMQGGLERLAQARGAMEREQIPEKGTRPAHHDLAEDPQQRRHAEG